MRASRFQFVDLAGSERIKGLRWFFLQYQNLAQMKTTLRKNNFTTGGIPLKSQEAHGGNTNVHGLEATKGMYQGLMTNFSLLMLSKVIRF